MIELYDEAIAEKIKGFIPKGSPITVASPNSVNDAIIKIKEASITFPVIFIKPNPFEYKEDQRNFTAAQYGQFVRKREDGILLYLQSDAIRLIYTLGVLTTRKEDSAGLIRDLIFKIRSSPRITIEIPFGLNRNYNFSVHQIGNIEFTHSRENFMESGILYAASVPFEVNGAQLFHVREETPQYLNPILGAV